jgi:hypothetical protein
MWPKAKPSMRLETIPPMNAAGESGRKIEAIKRIRVLFFLFFFLVEAGPGPRPRT